MGTDRAGGVGVEDGDAAVALNGTTTGSELALVRIDNVPVTVPGVVAGKAAVKIWLCPAARLAGTVRPAVLKPCGRDRSLIDRDGRVAHVRCGNGFGAGVADGGADRNAVRRNS
jgi:hypothetical protein